MEEKVALVIGSPIAHSLSPAIFSFIAYNEKKSLCYSKKEVRPNELNQFMTSQKNNINLLGLNVTLPLKELMLNEVSFLSPAAEATGAVNVTHKKLQTFEGHNTDVIGIEKSLEAKGFNPENKICLIWGAGGAAKAVAYVLGKMKAKTVFILNRSNRNIELANKFNVLFPQTKYISVSELGSVTLPLSLMVNTTPLGMTGKESGLSLFSESIKLNFAKNALAYDLIYTPSDTDFLMVAKNLGLETLGGLGMFIDQAIATWKIWMGELSNEKELHQKLEFYLKGILALKTNVKPIYLTGFIGVGKSTVGEKLAALTGRVFVDTDRMIMKKAGASISQIFEEKGEDYFRMLEDQMIIETLTLNSSVVSLGGGALGKEANLQNILGGGTLVYLAADVATLEKRISGENVVRPLLHGLDQQARLEKITELLHTRKPIYEKARYQIKTNDLNESAVAFEILSQIGEMS